jgi:mRNA interferase MazF
VVPSAINGLRESSDIMVDKAQSVPRERIGDAFGHLSAQQMLEVGRSLAVFLGVI